jgi:hypothetical protein
MPIIPVLRRRDEDLELQAKTSHLVPGYLTTPPNPRDAILHLQPESFQECPSVWVTMSNHENKLNALQDGKKHGPKR